MIRPAVVSVLAVFAGLALPGQAVVAQSLPSLKPGLWEQSVERPADAASSADANMRRAQAEIARLPPEQRRMVERMWAEQGVRMGAGGQGGSITQKICVTPAQAARPRIPGEIEGCRQTVTPNGGGWNVVSRCPAAYGRPATETRGVITFQGATGYAADYTSVSQGAGEGGDMRVKVRGRWLSGDCGGVRPDLD